MTWALPPVCVAATVIAPVALSTLVPPTMVAASPASENVTCLPRPWRLAGRECQSGGRGNAHPLVIDGDGGQRNRRCRRAEQAWRRWLLPWRHRLPRRPR
ncbi:hypothetical protein LP420_06210 [Massilia sp. B-10]|nr:hypothetical protein LP420_06210 [Massilia sp. B-10]